MLKLALADVAKQLEASEDSEKQTWTKIIDIAQDIEEAEIHLLLHL